MLDYYSILGVDRRALEHEIRKAYYEKAKRYHPDICKEADAVHIFQLLNEAYQTLINPQKRKKYDFKLQYGNLIEFSHVSPRAASPRSAAYEAYIKRRREEIRKENKEYSNLNNIINIVMLCLMGGILFLGFVFGLIDAILSYDFTMLIIILIFGGIFIYGVIYLKKNKVL